MIGSLNLDQLRVLVTIVDQSANQRILVETNKRTPVQLPVVVSEQAE